MTERKQKAGRWTPPDALALPHVIEAIATCSSSRKDLESFLGAVPRSLWTPALAAFLDCNTAMASWVGAEWPRIAVTNTELPTWVLARLAATLPLRPRIEIAHPIQKAAPLASLVGVLGPALVGVSLCFYDYSAVDGQGHTIARLLLQHCPRLRRVSIDAMSYSANDALNFTDEVNDVLAVLTHPHLKHVSINLGARTAAPRLGHLLAVWLSTAPATTLYVVDVAPTDDDTAAAFCDALQGNTTLEDLIIVNVPSFGGFHGRTLPVSLKTLEWKGRDNEVVDNATVTDLATAVGRTQLQKLDCNCFGPLATRPAAAPMLSQLQSLTVHGVNGAHTKALIEGLSSVPALTYLTLRNCSLSSSMELLMEMLATTCIASLHVDDQYLTREDSASVLSGVLQVPRLRALTLSMRLLDVFFVLPELVAAGRQLYSLDLKTIARENAELGKRAIYRALALVHDVPFVTRSLPAAAENFVVSALGRRSDRRHTCRLDL
ncbi:hypothetical protein SPRG_09384 [Saprolegnia parasitica CBS 223.65]|uniref:F-box domain-containing protein n=1 Tax=Saprolegnia parasitica (strain CBS 223.65) TaxID=695850 RepID=A0A067CF43_SAPPC|nr:hypothetical protein SPRG_09384 [Saprolegnia parasitica CBS 223.65]KDO25442.1 hypothetical protein SPRG_09384 [Saprolegnia parasitica CBS 223.65]|eukprot:XP_012203868.1 hypothetical protein SPRG_09384 [Saprolegnia parasitica CBS 223.65]